MAYSLPRLFTVKTPKVNFRCPRKYPASIQNEKKCCFQISKDIFEHYSFFLFVHGETIDIDRESCFFVFLLFSAGGAAAVFLTTRFTTTNV